MWGTMIPLNITVFGAVYSSWFICASCGFVETWVEDERDLQRIRKNLANR